MATVVNHTNTTRGPVTEVQLSVGATWTDQPAAVTEFGGLTTGRKRVDLRPYNLARLSVNIQGVAGATTDLLQVQYSVDGGSTWLYLDGLLTTNGGPQAPVGVTNAAINTTQYGPWAVIAAAAKTESTLIRLVGLGGDATVDPVFGNVAVTFSA